MTYFQIFGNIYVSDKENGKLVILEKEYDNKKSFKMDLVGNGYSVRFIATPETFDEECEKYYARKEAKRFRAECRRRANKECAAMLGMNVKEYKKWLKM